MNTNNRTHPLSLDRYKSFLNEAKQLNKPLSFYEHSVVGYIATIIFVVIDFVCLYTVWNIVQTESSILVRLLALGCAICLDVPMAIAGLSLKRYYQGVMRKNIATLITICSIATFAITFVFALWFRIETKDLTFEIGSMSTMSNSVSVESSSTNDSNAVFIAALFNGVIPLCTSIASFVITFFASNPLKETLYKLNKEHISLISRKTEIAMVLEEAKKVDTYKEFLLAREMDMYNQFFRECESMGNLRKQATGLAIMEKLANPDEITVTTESRAEVNAALDNEKEPYTDATQVVSQNNKEENVA